jgi:hypothetical protein
MCGIEYAWGAGRIPKGMTMCVPKEMPPAEIEQKIDAESLTGTGPWWKVSGDTTFQSGEAHPCPCNHQPARLHYLLLIACGRSLTKSYLQEKLSSWN